MTLEELGGLFSSSNLWCFFSCCEVDPFLLRELTPTGLASRRKKISAKYADPTTIPFTVKHGYYFASFTTMGMEWLNQKKITFG